MKNASPKTAPPAPRNLTLMLASAGFLPFLALSLIQALQPQLSIAGVSPLDLLAGYSLAIASFMAGTLWQPGRPARLLVIANVLALAAWLLAVFRPLIWMPAMALIFALILWAERRWLIQHSQYQEIRLALTWAVKLCLLAVFLDQWW